MKVAVLGLDLDGTLVDSLGLTLEIMTGVLAEHVSTPPSAAQVKELFGLPEERIFGVFVGEKKAAQVQSEYLMAFEGRLKEFRCFEGVEDVLRGARGRGLKIGLYTARGRAATERILDHLGIGAHLDWWITGSDLKDPKPHPEGLLQMARGLGAQPHRCVYVGDSPKDVRMARAAGFRAIAANWCSGSSAEELRAERPHHLLTDPRQLSSLLV